MLAKPTVDSLTIHEAAAFMVRVCDAREDPNYIFKRSAFSEQLSIEKMILDYQLAMLKPGDLVFIARPNGRSLVRRLFAAILYGLVPCLVNPSLPGTRLNQLARRFGARAAMITTGAMSEQLTGARHKVEDVDIAHFESSSVASMSAGEMIILTSGSSGISSGCVHEIQALFLNAKLHSEAIGLTEQDSILANLPLYYSYALVAQTFAALVSGARLVIDSPPFSPSDYLFQLKKWPISVSSLTPNVVKRLQSSNTVLPDELRALTVGGDHLEAGLVSELLSSHSELELYLTYGLTEAGPRVSTLAAHREPASRRSSVGQPLPGVEVELDDPSSSGERELLLRSNTLMKRRIGDIEGRKRDWKAPRQLATGDYFQIDEEGYLYFRGRLSDYIIRNGEKINLTSIRGLVTELIKSSRAQTTSYKCPLKGEDFDLILFHPPSIPQSDYQHMERQLKRQLRASERPRQFFHKIMDPSTAESYK